MSESQQPQARPFHVFIGWSQQRSESYDAAQALSALCKACLGHESCKITTSRDIPKGDTWASELCLQLAQADVGIFCITEANHRNPWMSFESGMVLGRNGKLSTGKAGGDGKLPLLRSRLIPLVFGQAAGNIKGPFGTLQVQSYIPQKECGSFLLDLLCEWTQLTPFPQTRGEIEQVFGIAWPGVCMKIDDAIIRHRNEQTPVPVPADLELVPEEAANVHKQTGDMLRLVEQFINLVTLQMKGNAPGGKPTENPIST